MLPCLHIYILCHPQNIIDEGRTHSIILGAGDSYMGEIYYLSLGDLIKCLKLKCQAFIYLLIGHIFKYCTFQVLLQILRSQWETKAYILQGQDK